MRAGHPAFVHSDNVYFATIVIGTVNIIACTGCVLIAVAALWVVCYGIAWMRFGFTMPGFIIYLTYDPTLPHPYFGKHTSEINEVIQGLAYCFTACLICWLLINWYYYGCPTSIVTYALLLYYFLLVLFGNLFVVFLGYNPLWCPKLLKKILARSEV